MQNRYFLVFDALYNKKKKKKKAMGLIAYLRNNFKNYSLPILKRNICLYNLMKNFESSSCPFFIPLTLGKQL